MRLLRVMSRCTPLLTAALLLPALWAPKTGAQEPDRLVFSGRFSSLAEVRAAMDEALRRGAPAEEVDRIAAEMDRFGDEGGPAWGLARGASPLDRAFGYVWTNNLEFRMHNFNHVGQDGISCEFYPSPNLATSRHRLNYFITLAVGVPTGPWGNAQVQEQSAYWNSLVQGDWEAKDGSRGTLLADPPQTRFDYPLMAISSLEATWPTAGWPAPETEVATWYGTETWTKWSRKADMEFYGEFTDAYAGRDETGESYPLGIDVRFRVMQYGGIPAGFLQYELTNNSSNTYTDVFLSLLHLRNFGDRNDYTSAGYPRWNGERNLLYGVGKRYEPATGIHYVSTSTSNTQQAGWGGFVFLQSPTGSFRTDAADDTSDTPSQVLTRLAMVNSGDRVAKGSDHEWGFYGALSGEVSYFDDPATLEKIWKTLTQGGGSPVLFQTEANFKFYWHGPHTVPPEDPWNPPQLVIDSWSTNGYIYPSSGPFTWAPGEKIDYVAAEVWGNTEAELLTNASKVILSYQAKLSASGPPDTPRLRTNGVMAGRDHRVYNRNLHPYPIHFAPSGPITLFWDGSASESSIDAITQNSDFQGYRIYKSSNRGSIWGDEITDENAVVKARKPIATFDLIDGVTGKDPLGYKSLGTDSGIQHQWTDTNVIDGFEYWYAITAYDYDPAQDPAKDSFESNIGADPTTPNVIAVIAGSRPAGYMPGMVGSGAAAAEAGILYLPAEPERETSILIEVVDDNLITGHDYSVTVTDHAVYGYAEFDYLGGLMVRDVTQAIDLFTDPVLGSRPEYGFDNVPVVDGFRILSVDPVDGSGNPVTDGAIYDFSQTTDVDATAAFTVSLQEVYMASAGSAANRANRTGLMNTIEFRFTGWGNVACLATAGGGNAIGAPINVPFEMWDIDTGTRLMALCYWPGQITWDGDYTLPTTIPYFQADGVTVTNVQALHPATDTEYWNYDTSNPNSRSDWVYRIRFNERTPATIDNYWDPGDVWTLTPYRLLRGLAGQTFTFETTEATTVEAEVDLDLIQAVPNPYYIFARWDRDMNARKIEFTNVPPNSTVDIYTLNGELIASLQHDETYHSDKVGSVYWKLWTYEYTEAAYGLYLFVVKTRDGQTKVGKFAIIR